MQPRASRKFLLNSTYAAPSLRRRYANRWLAGMAGMKPQGQSALYARLAARPAG